MDVVVRDGRRAASLGAVAWRESARSGAVGNWVGIVAAWPV